MMHDDQQSKDGATTTSSSSTAASPATTTSQTAATTPAACPTCGVNIHQAYAQLERAQDQLHLLQEKLHLEEELLKSDKRNFKRRLAAAKHANRQHRMDMKEQQTLQKESEMKRHALELQRLHDQLQGEQDQKSKEGELLQTRIRELEELVLQQQQQRNDQIHASARTTDAASRVGVDQRHDREQELQRRIDEQQEAIASYEMQLLELEQVRGGEGSSVGRSISPITMSCVNCRRLEGRVAECQADLDELQLDARAKKDLVARLERVCLAKETDIACLQLQLQQLLDAPPPLAGLATSAVDANKDEKNGDEDGSTATKQLRLENQRLRQQVQVLTQQQQQQQQDLATTTAAASAPAMEEDTDSRHNNSLHVLMELEWHGPTLSGIYTGAMLDELPNGEGTLRTDDGAIYHGEWQAGLRHGHGVYATVEGDIYHGMWNADKHHGYGTYVWSDGRVYMGTFDEGQRHGSNCVMTFPYGATYQGDYNQDKRSGHGVYCYADGRCYTGAYSDDRPHGQGVLRSTDGIILYDGPWELGEFIG